MPPLLLDRSAARSSLALCSLLLPRVPLPSSGQEAPWLPLPCRQHSWVARREEGSLWVDGTGTRDTALVTGDRPQMLQPQRSTRFSPQALFVRVIPLGPSSPVRSPPPPKVAPPPPPAPDLPSPSSSTDSSAPFPLSPPFSGRLLASFSTVSHWSVSGTKRELLEGALVCNAVP